MVYQQMYVLNTFSLKKFHSYHFSIVLISILGGISGKILLCDDDCKKKWDATQGANPAPAPGPGPSAPATDPAPAPKPDAPRPSNPKSKEKGTKEPSAGKGSKQPTMKGKGTPVPEPVRRQMKNRKDARV